MRPSLYGLEEFGLTLQRLRSLGNRLVTLTAYWTSGIPDEKLFPYSPNERIRRLREAYRSAYRRVKEQWPTSEYILKGSAHDPRGLFCRVKAKEVPSLLRIPDLSFIFVDKVAGLRKKSLRTQTVYAVKARFGVQVEDQTKGYQNYEDRIVLIRANSKKDALLRLRRPFREYGQPGIQIDGKLRRSKFEAILEVYDLIDPIDATLDPAGTEVYSSFGCRRMRSANAWHPRKSRKPED